MRGPEFYAAYLSGRVLDIGCGDDLVVPGAQPFDREHGDAARILDHFPPGTFDSVHSSHCLEHMPDVPAALAQWWALVRPGGYLVLVVPDEDLFELGAWPSLFNTDHKASFRLGGPAGRHPASYELRGLLAGLAGADIVSIRVQDDGYDHALRHPVTRHGRALVRFGGWRSAAMRRFLGAERWVAGLDAMLTRLEHRLGRPVAQTDGPALAQIEAVVRKRAAG